MAKLFYKQGAIKQCSLAARALGAALDKLPSGNETVVGRGEINRLLGKSEGRRLKDVLITAVKRYHITRFADDTGSIIVEVLDVKKPLLRVRRV
ncbi:MAG: hypothetical protein QXT82_11525 [Candidatus Caldarchaeum sp.]